MEENQYKSNSWNLLVNNLTFISTITIRAPVFDRNQNSAPQSITENNSPWKFIIWILNEWL